jgi:hypothetical protein
LIRTRILAAFVGLLAIAACSEGGRGVVYAPSAAPTSGSVTVSPPKIPLRGLLDMQDISWHDTDNATPPPFDIAYVSGYPGSFGGVVINVAWSQMQSSSGAAINTSVIDTALGYISTYNMANQSSPLGVKLRIYAGSNAPLWAKDMAGGPITIYRNPAGCNGQTDTCPLTLGPYWTTPYITAWRAFQAQVAEKYDTNPLIIAVAVTSCAEQTDEPFVASTGPVSKANLVAAGLNDTLQQSCLSGATTDYAAWQNTDIDFTFNSYNKLTGGLDTAFSQSVMTICRQMAPNGCVLDNHALETPITSDPGIYTDIQNMGGLINFQTQSPEGMGCIWPETITQGLILGARAIEVWPEKKFQGFTTLTVPEVASLEALFYAPVPTTTPVPSPLPDPCSGYN